ncbi:putative Protein daughterless [Operophtera brumata]|uniref:Uncharacterized protein n=1 Tax=Operophtera brumata TaxID=104452 RepID=A0A0L7LJH1_OPEBR|nr:putative Protein daughterless [Operophtera brumata]
MAERQCYQNTFKPTKYGSAKYCTASYEFSFDSYSSCGSFYGSDEFGHDSPSRYASPKGAGAGGSYQEPYYGGGEWGAPGYYQPPPPYQHDPYATSPGETLPPKTRPIFIISQ